MDLLRYLNAVTIKEEELAEALAAAKEAHNSGETCSMTGIMTTVRLFDDAPHKAKAVIFRLQALARLIAASELEDWILAAGVEFVPAATGALISAAADHPLSLEDGEISFERHSFLRRALELLEPQVRSVS